MPTLRVEIIRTGKSSNSPGTSYGSPIEGALVAQGELTISATPTASGGQVTAPAESGLVCRAEAVGGACYVAIGSPADPSAEPRRYIPDGGSREFEIDGGEKVGCVQASIS